MQEVRSKMQETRSKN